jgi:hypothetical protein
VGPVWGKDLENKNTRSPASRLARTLRPFEIKSKNVRVGDKMAKGYERSDFEDTWALIPTEASDGA